MPERWALVFAETTVSAPFLPLTTAFCTYSHCSGPVHLLLAQDLAFLSQEIHEWHARETHARDMLARTKHSLHEYVELYRTMCQERDRLQAEVQELKGASQRGDGLVPAR